MSGAGYQILDERSVEAYVRARPELAALVAEHSKLTIREVGDGNLNLVFVVRGNPSRPGLVLKQALPWVRVHGPEWQLTPERAVAEARAYETYTSFAPELVPKYHGFDRRNYVLAIEDLANWKVWRTALNAGEVHPRAGRAMGQLVGRIAFHTSVFGTAPEAFRRATGAAINAELCKITEDLVLTEPFTEHERNWNHPGVDGLVAQLRSDATLLAAVNRLKYRFLTSTQALIHGDLHTGSVMVGDRRAVAIDPEFCFYGPVGFDLGALWANFVISAARAAQLERRQTFQRHLSELIADSWLGFESELMSLWPQRSDRSLGDRFLRSYLDDVWGDAIGFAGTKMVRRMIGYAHVTDIETLPEPQRTAAAAVVLRVARRFILERQDMHAPGDAWTVVDGELRPGR